MSEAAAGSCSGGEDCHLSIGFIEPIFRVGAGVPGLGAISTGLLDGFGEDGKDGVFDSLPRLRALANQFAI